MRENTEKTLTCEASWKSDQARSCKISEQTIPKLGRLSIEAGRNGGVTVKGWTRNQTLIRARIEAMVPTEAEATLLAGQVQIETASGILRATGPDSKDNRWWSVSWEVFTPHATDLTLSAHNGGLSVSDVRGRLEAKTHNGGLTMSRVGGEVTGATHNGGIQAEMMTGGGALRLETHNGGIQLKLPANASARLKAETNNGSIRSDFPLPDPGRDERRRKSV